MLQILLDPMTTLKISRTENYFSSKCLVVWVCRFFPDRLTIVFWFFWRFKVGLEGLGVREEELGFAVNFYMTENTRNLFFPSGMLKCES